MVRPAFERPSRLQSLNRGRFLPRRTSTPSLTRTLCWRGSDRDNVVPWDLDLANKTVRLREPTSAVLKMEFAAKPMLGCIGVAPAGDFAPTSSPAGPYGGNLDYNEIGEGTTVMLPVYHPGG